MPFGAFSIRPFMVAVEALVKTYVRKLVRTLRVVASWRRSQERNLQVLNRWKLLEIVYGAFKVTHRNLSSAKKDGSLAKTFKRHARKKWARSQLQEGHIFRTHLIPFRRSLSSADHARLSKLGRHDSCLSSCKVCGKVCLSCARSSRREDDLTVSEAGSSRAEPETTAQLGLLLNGAFESESTNIIVFLSRVNFRAKIHLPEERGDISLSGIKYHISLLPLVPRNGTCKNVLKSVRPTGEGVLNVRRKNGCAERPKRKANFSFDPAVFCLLQNRMDTVIGWWYILGSMGLLRQSESRVQPSFGHGINLRKSIPPRLPFPVTGTQACRF